MTDEAVKRARMEAHAECEARPRRGDGSRIWLGVVIAAGCALATAAVIGAAVLGL